MKHISNNSGRLPKEKKEEIMAKLVKIVESGQIVGVTNTQLADTLCINRNTVANFLQEIYEIIGVDNLPKLKIDIKLTFDRFFRMANQMLVESKDNDEREKRMRLMLNIMDKKLDFFERLKKFN